MTSHSKTIRSANSVLLTGGRPGQVEEFFTEDYVVHLTAGEIDGGHESIRKVLGMLAKAFPALEVDVEILLEGEDKVAWQRTLRGVQQGAYRGFPASGREIVWREMLVSRFEAGRIAEEWLSTDLAEQLLRARKN